MLHEIVGNRLFRLVLLEAMLKVMIEIYVLHKIVGNRLFRLGLPEVMLKFMIGI